MKQPSIKRIAILLALALTTAALMPLALTAGAAEDDGQILFAYEKALESGIIATYNGVVVSDPINGEFYAYHIDGCGSILGEEIKMPGEVDEETDNDRPLISEGHGINPSAGGGIPDDDETPDDDDDSHNEEEALHLQAENATITGVLPGSVSISSSVSNITLQDLVIGGDFQVTGGTQVTVRGDCLLGSYNGSDELPGDGSNVNTQNGTLTIAAYEAQTVCAKCNKVTKFSLIEHEMPCNVHYICKTCLAENESIEEEHQLLLCGLHAVCMTPADDDSHKTTYICGEHYLCDEAAQSYDVKLHEEKGSKCEEYMCHNPDAHHHTRCTWCGGALCNGKAHGDGECANFKPDTSNQAPVPEVDPPEIIDPPETDINTPVLDGPPEIID